MNRKINLILALVLGIALFINVHQALAQEEVVLPGDVPVFGGLSLSLSMSLLVGLLTYLKVIKPENKKLLGVILAVFGFLAAGVYAYQTGLRDELLLKNAFAGVFIGLGSVGMHSTAKNALQFLFEKVKK